MTHTHRMRRLRREHSRRRLSLVRQLRASGAPVWVIKDEQVRMVCNRQGLRGHGNRLANQLRERHVLPRMVGA